MIVVADASPLIFLCKLDRLDWIPSLLGTHPLVPSLVAAELLRPPIPPAEKRLLERYLRQCDVAEPATVPAFATALSAADNQALALAVARNAELLLADDRLLRSMATVEQIHPLGTLGLLIRAQRAGLVNQAEAVALLRNLVRHHGFRIGIEVYDGALAALTGPVPELNER